jgi:putative transposase
MRWHAHHHTEGTGHLYQGRFKTFPIEDDSHLLAVLRYVERNPVRASLWLAYVNEANSESELEAIRRSVIRGTPYGSESWVTQSAARLQLKHTLRPKGRPKKPSSSTKSKQ